MPLNRAAPLRPATREPRRIGTVLRARLAASAAVLLLVACGGSGNPLDNPASVQNPPAASGGRLSFLYFQRCVNPIFLASLAVNLNGTVVLKTCAASGCHDSAYGSGGAFRIIPTAATVDLTTTTAAAARASDMYRNFTSAQAETVIGAPGASLLLEKPLLQGVLHGGSQVFPDVNDPDARRIAYWISNPMPAGQDEFSTAGNSLFTPADANTGTCNG